MADPKKPETTNKAGTTTAAVDDHMHDVNLDRKMWTAKKAQDELDGRVIGREIQFSQKSKNPENPDGKFEVIILRLLKPASWKDDDDKIIEAKAGEDVMIVATSQLERFLKHGENAERCPRLIISFAGVRAVGKGKMNLYKAREEDEEFWAKRAEFAPDTLLNFSAPEFETKQIAAPSNGVSAPALPAAGETSAAS